MKNKINLLIFIGTRPEGIKLAPIIKQLDRRKDRFNYKICSTGQHREMLKQVFDFFEIMPDIDLDLMTGNQTLGLLSSKILEKVDKTLDSLRPDLIFIQGDTTTAFLAALAAFYKKIKIGHVEAGLRTFDKYNPFPEEINRQLISRIADYNFAPTQLSFNNLVKDNVSTEKIFLTGNTVVDAINWGIKKIHKNAASLESKEPFSLLREDSKIILLTMHRRESFGQDIKNICLALKEIAGSHKNIQIVYPVHPNPNVKDDVYSLLGGIRNIILTDPLDYESFIWMMDKSYFIITDSGGVQEEAPTLDKPVLVIRQKTERMESINLGISKLIGTSKDTIINEVSDLIENEETYKSMTGKANPYGDGEASVKILDIVESLI